jgi:hypothetical protein
MNQDLITIVTPTTEFEANVLAIVLKDNGVDAFVFGTPAIGMGVNLSGGVMGVPVQVRREDVAAARQILSDNKRNSIDIDWDDFEGLADEEVQDAYRPMPITARIAFFCVVLALISFVLLVILNL